MSSSPTNKPALVLVPGICSIATKIYAPLISVLLSKPHNFTDLKPVDLPSADSIATKASLEPSGLHVDIAATRAAIEEFLAQGKDVVVVGHSYGGTVALFACTGLWKGKGNGNREGNVDVRGGGGAAGVGAGVLRVVLLCASLTLPGGTVAGDRQDYEKEHGVIDLKEGERKVELHGDEYFLIPEGFEKIWFPDVHDPEIRSSLRPSPLSTVLTPAPEADVPDWKISYLIARGDSAMPERFMNGLIERARENGAIVETETIDSGHFVQVSHVDEVARWIDEVVR